MKRKNILIAILIIFLMPIFACQKMPDSGFIMNPTTAKTGDTIIFINTSSDAYSYSWDFGDSKTSDIDNPTHSYENAGIYTVVLTAYSKDGEKSDKAIASIIVSKYYFPIWFTFINNSTDTIEALATHINLWYRPLFNYTRTENFHNISPFDSVSMSTEPDAFSGCRVRFLVDPPQGFGPPWTSDTLLITEKKDSLEYFNWPSDTLNYTRYY